MNSSSPKPDSDVRRTLARDVLVKAGLRVAAVILVVTAVAYYSMVRTLETHALSQLTSYVRERCVRESQIFRLAQDNHRILAAELLKRYTTPVGEPFGNRFDQLVAREADGVWRNRRDGSHRAEQPCIYLDEKLVIDDNVRRRVEIYHDLCVEYGPAWRSRFQDTYIHHPDGIMVLYWPERSTWCQQARASLEIAEEEYSWVADPKHDPERRSVWTGVFYDHVADLWMTSCETPVYDEDQHIATIGNDILLNELIQRTIDDRLPHARNILFRPDGRLIAHTNIMMKINASQGRLLITETDDESLRAVFAAVGNLRNGQVAVNPANGAYLGIGRIEGPDWYFVVELSRKAVSGPAVRTGRVILLLGSLSLVAEILILSLVLNRNVARPLGDLVRATNAIAASDQDVPIDTTRKDELGRLARSVQHMRNVIRDRMASLQYSESRFRTLVEQAGDGIFLSDMQGRLVDVNQRACDSLGYSRDELLRMNVTDIDAGFDNMNKLNIAWNDLGPGQAILLESTHRRKDGTEFPVEIRIGLLQREGEAFVLGIARDISARKQQEEELHRKNEEMERFAYTTSHDLRSPLVTIRAFLGHIRKSLQTGDLEQVHRNLTFMDNAATKMASLLDELLELSRIGRVVNPPEEVSLQELAQEAMALVAGRIEQRGVQVHVTAQPCRLRGDRPRLLEVYQNLIDNAVKFMGDQASPRVEIGVERRGSDIVLFVKDNGMGIDTRYRHRLFGLFERLHPEIEGTGMGLAMIKRIVEFHGGRIWAESDGDGLGTTFCFTLRDTTLDGDAFAHPS